jgi:UDP-3-O-[3-hydroxymyristoyl] N-acetylglucosamine deacetylase
MIKQRTLKNAIRTTGVGIHSGEAINLVLHPADENKGIIFRRTDIQPEFEIPALMQYVVNTQLNTSITRDNVTINTIEHLMSALAATGIDNAYIEVDSGEVPIMDGSADPFARLIKQAGILEQEAPKSFIRILSTVSVEKEGKIARLEPHEGFRFAFEIDFAHPVISRSNQKFKIDFAHASYIEEISRTRTFGFLKDYEYLVQNKLARGASLENTVVLDDDKVVNPEGLRDPDEFVKHKILDAVGDLFMLGHVIIGSFEGIGSGHKINHLLCQALKSDRLAWELVQLPDHAKLPVSFSLQ